MEDSISLAEQFETTNLLAMGKAQLANCLFLLGEYEAVPPLCDQAIELADATHDRLAGGMAYRTVAEAFGELHKEDASRAEAAILEAIKIQEACVIRPELARSFVSYSRLLRGWERTDKATEYLVQATNMFQQMGMEWDLAQAEHELAT